MNDPQPCLMRLLFREPPAIAGPERMVIDVNTGEFAAGQR
jgi:hypothetical protein